MLSHMRPYRENETGRNRETKTGRNSYTGVFSIVDLLEEWELRINRMEVKRVSYGNNNKEEFSRSAHQLISLHPVSSGTRRPFSHSAFRTSL